MKQRILQCFLLLTVALFFSTTFFLSQHTRASIERQPSAYNGSPTSLPTALPGPTLQANSTDQGLQERLTADALASLKGEYDIKLTGQRPTRELVTRYDGERHRERTGEERVSAGLRLHGHYQTSVRRLRDVEVTLAPSAVRIEGDKILLQATEHTIYHYNVRPGVALPDTSEDQITHVFVFRNQSTGLTGMKTGKPNLIRTAYSGGNTKTRATATSLPQMTLECGAGGNCMVYDSTGCDPYGYYPCADPDFDNSTYCCYTEEAQYLQPSGDAALNPNVPQATSSYHPSGCNYNGSDAGWYAYLYAMSPNPSYRYFDNDCTNFVSQALAEGGRWCVRGYLKNYKNWYHWWYNPSGRKNTGQTRTWTQAVALNFFVRNTGRGYNTTNLCDLSEGDLMFADWQNNGTIDHAMIIDYVVNCSLGFDGVLLAQHSPSRRHKSLAEYFQDEPNAYIYPYWICHSCI